MLFSYYKLGDSMALKGIVIDPGHGGTDSGAVYNGVKEKDLTLKISQYMYDRFKELGVPVTITRNTDTTLSSDVRPRVVLDKFGNSNDIIVLSNHINAGGAEGAEVIYALRNKDTLANKILNNLSKKGQIARKVYQRRLPSNPSKDYYYIHRETPNTEPLIIEYGFIDNSKDLKKINDNYKEYVEAVIEAVMDYKGLKYIPKLSGNSYIVKSGDTLWSIAKNNGITVDKLKEINNLNSNLLTIGQVLKLSNNQDTSNKYIVKSGDTLYGIAKKYGVTVDELKKDNNLNSNTLKIGQVLIIPNKDEIYIVKSGDTLYGIANKFDTTVQKLKDINSLNSNLLTVGQKLIVK